MPFVLRLVATVASLSFTIQGLAPLALACCSTPSVHSCCLKPAQSEEASSPQLGKAPCCKAETRVQAAHKDDATRGQVQTPSAAPAVEFAQLLPPQLAQPSILPGVSPPGSLRAQGPPLPLRI